MQQQNNFKNFDRLGINLLLGFYSFNTFHDNGLDTFGFFDASGTSYHKGVIRKSLFEIKCNKEYTNNCTHSIITKADFDKLLANTPSDVDIFYICFTDTQTNVFNLRKVAADPSVYYTKTIKNKSTEMNANSNYRDEEIIYLNRLMCRQKRYLKRHFKGALTFGYNIDNALQMRYY